MLQYAYEGEFPESAFRPGRKLTAAGFSHKGLAIGTLRHGGVSLMGAHTDSLKSAVVFGLSIVFTLLNVAVNAGIFHNKFLLL